MLNKLHIDLENRMTPLELDELCSELMSAQHLPEALHFDLREILPSSAQRDWAEKLQKLYAKSRKHCPEPFRRHRLRRDVMFFDAGGERSCKTLAICFSGQALRMMMPLPVFLQHIDSEHVDIAFLRDPDRNGYRGGVRGVADSLELSIDKLKDILRIGDYRSVVSIGVSAGGVPATLSALRLNLDAALSVGGSHPDDPRWTTSDGTKLRDVFQKYVGQSVRMPKIFLVFGADYPKDKTSAVELASLVPARLIAISAADGFLGHNALYPVLISGELGGLLKSTVLANP